MRRKIYYKKNFYSGLALLVLYLAAVLVRLGSDLYWERRG